jgi:hypothetical protein
MLLFNCWHAWEASGHSLCQLQCCLNNCATTFPLQVTLSNANKSAAIAWHASYPDYAIWVQLRLQHLAADPGDWPPALVKTAAAAALQEELAVVAANSSSKQSSSAAAAVGRPQQQAEGSERSALFSSSSSSSSSSSALSRRRKRPAAAVDGMSMSNLSAHVAGGEAVTIISLQQQQQQQPFIGWSAAAAMPGDSTWRGNIGSSHSSMAQPLRVAAYCAATSSSSSSSNSPVLTTGRMQFFAAVQHDVHLLQQQETAAQTLAGAVAWQSGLFSRQPGLLLRQLAARSTVFCSSAWQSSAQLEPLLSSSSSSISSQALSSSRSSSRLHHPLWCATAGWQQAIAEFRTWAATQWWNTTSSSSSSSSSSSNCSVSTTLSLSGLIRQRSMYLSQHLVEAAAASKQWQQQQLETSLVQQMSALMA